MKSVDQLLRAGFDLTAIAPGNYVRPRCSQCEVAVLNGVACHEHGCPNATRECVECGTVIPRHEQRCDDCAGRVDPW